MKFEINENKLDKIIFRYLDGKNFIIKETPENYYFIENEEDEYAQIRIRKNDKVCFIYYKLADEIESFFSIESSMAENVLIRYVENTSNIKVSNTNKEFYRFFNLLIIP
jgi:hypothetical protein